MTLALTDILYLCMLWQLSELKIVNFIYFYFYLHFLFLKLELGISMVSHIYHMIQSQVIVTQSHIIEEHKRFQNNNIILYVNCQEHSIKYIYNTSQMSKLSLTLHTFSITGSVAGLILTLIAYSIYILQDRLDLIQHGLLAKCI